MNTITKALSHNRSISVSLLLVFAVALMLIISGCSTKAVAAPDPAASAASVEEKPAPAPAANEFIKSFDEVVTYQDGISISVGLVGPFTPSNIQTFPIGEGETAAVFKIVLTNNSDEVFEPGSFPQVSSGGKPATFIADSGNTEYPGLGFAPTTSILPGQTLEWFSAFGVTDMNDITFEISPSPFGYQDAIFTNVPL